jgi:transposase-like protein
MRTGTRSKTVLSEIGPVGIEVPRDRDGSFKPVIVPKRKRRLDGIDEVVLSLSARGLTTGEITAALAQWSARLLDPIYPVLFVDAVVVTVRDGQVRNTPFYVVMGVSTSGEREIPGIWAGAGGEGRGFWLQVFSALKNRCLDDVLVAVDSSLGLFRSAELSKWVACDGLRRFPGRDARSPTVLSAGLEACFGQKCINHHEEVGAMIGGIRVGDVLDGRPVVDHQK